MEKQQESEIPQQTFEDQSQEQAILAEMPGELEYAAAAGVAGRSEGADGGDALPVLTREQEYHLFRKMNFLKSRAGRSDAQPGDLQEAEAIRDRLIRANLKLLFKILKHSGAQPGRQEDLVSDGELALWRAVEKFDYTRGRRFSTFATKVIRRRLNARIARAVKRQGVVQFVDEYPEEGDAGRAALKSGHGEGPDVESLLDTLPPREREVVLLRHGFGENRGMSLTEVADELRISKTRVRQLEQQAYARLRESAEPVAC